MTDPSTFANLPEQGVGADRRVTQLEAGRIRLCNDLLVSLNRSWQVETPSPNPPAAAFKAMAPLAFWANDGKGSGDIYLAAIAAQDAWWLGFEAEGAPHAIVPEIDGRNALTGQSNDTTPDASPNHLVVPDQPWFDATRDESGLFHQLVPHYQHPDKPGATLRLTAYTLNEDMLTRHPDADEDEVQPLYGAGTPSAQAPAHRWSGRTLIEPHATLNPCARLTIHLMKPEQFQDLTGEPLDLSAFADTGKAPPPFDPFQ